MAESSSEDEYYYSDHDSLDGLDNDDAEVQWAPPHAPSCKVITKESLLVAQRDDLQRVMDLLQLKENQARTLLIHYRWDVDKLIVVYVEQGGTSLFSQAGVTVIEQQDSRPSPSSTVICFICMEDDISSDCVSTMDCGHCFCNDCWTEHFIVKINEGQSKRIKCMAEKCNAICDESVVIYLVRKRKPYLAEKFEHFLLESYIEDNKMVKWCPSVPHCGNAIRVEEDQLCEVECSCGLQFCFSCLSEVHSPCSCLMWELWTNKCRGDLETVNWMAIHTKSCPKCHKPVEKKGGCNIVTCVCGQAFCWLCGGAGGHTWAYIRSHKCGPYKEAAQKKAECAKHDFYRHMHYRSRYKAHTDSFLLESKLKDLIRMKVSISEENASTLKDFSWAMNGLYRLFRSRRVLSFSYPFSYFMFGEDLFSEKMTKEEREIKQNLFEDQQQQLEENIEKLSKYLEEPFHEYIEDQVKETRIQVINLSVVTDNLCKKMYEGIENDLLDSLQGGTHNIAPYSSSGIERASDLFSCTKLLSNKHQHSYYSTNGNVY
ncbi:unnamed protein product [Rhodiola kirilowii]